MFEYSRKNNYPKNNKINYKIIEMYKNKKEMHLPQNFQEVMISNEILLKKKISDDTIRKLVYLYSVSTSSINFIYSIVGNGVL